AREKGAQARLLRAAPRLRPGATATRLAQRCRRFFAPFPTIPGSRAWGMPASRGLRSRDADASEGAGVTDSVNEQIVLETARLRLRQWRLSDYKPFAALNADPEVMRCVGPPLSEQESNQLARRMEDAIAQRGWGLWAVELLSNGRFIGCAGLNPLEARF